MLLTLLLVTSSEEACQVSYANTSYRAETLSDFYGEKPPFHLQLEYQVFTVCHDMAQKEYIARRINSDKCTVNSMRSSVGHVRIREENVKYAI